MASDRHLEVAKGFGALAFLAVGHVVTAIASAKLFYTGSDAAGLWLANAFAAGVVLRAGFVPLRLLVATVTVAAVAANALLGQSLENLLMYSATNIASIFLAVGLVSNRFVDWRESVSDARRYLLTILLAGGLAPSLAGIVFATVETALHGGSLLPTWWLWLSGDALGYVIVLPVMLFASRASMKAFRQPKTVSQFVIALGFVVLAAIAGSSWTNFPLVMLLLPAMVSAAFLPMFMLAIVCAFAVIAVLLAVAMTPTPVGPIAEAMAAYRFQISLAICAILPMLGGLVIEQMRTDRRRIADSEERFRRAMKDSAMGVVVVALDGRIVETNAAFTEMVGYSAEELETKAFSGITYAEDADIGADIMTRVRAGTADCYKFEKRYVRKDGSTVWARVAGSVIRDSTTGAPSYLVSQIENIDARKKSEAAIAAAETRWDFALASAGQGVWDLDLRKGTTTYSSTWKQMLGYEQHELDGDPELWLALVHPEDRARVEKADSDHMEGRTPVFEAEFRMRHKEGHYLWILDRGQVVERAPDGAVLRAIGTLTDITMRREAEDRLVSYTAMVADEKERLRVTLNAIGDAVICTDADNRVTFMNPVAEKLTRVSEADALHMPLSEIYRSVDEETGERITHSPAVGDDRTNSRAVLVRADGSRCSVREVVSAITTEKGEFGGSVIVFQDFTDARTLQRELAYAAAHDALTGLANRSSFIQTMELLVAQPGESAPAQFLFIDLDRFKLVNDTGGHAAGDALLKRVAETITALVRPGDVVSRLGGDEFAVILKSCSAREAEAMANRIVGAIGTLDFSWNGRRHVVGASIGVAPLGPAGEEIDEIIARADEACYSAKASGRNCVAVFEADAAGRSNRARKLASAS